MVQFLYIDITTNIASSMCSSVPVAISSLLFCGAQDPERERELGALLGEGVGEVFPVLVSYGKLITDYSADGAAGGVPGGQRPWRLSLHPLPLQALEMNTIYTQATIQLQFKRAD